ncbi:MAG: ABC transporter substrate-binding protein [Deltaproteobacteria bacterium]|nr:ABC transporter substrate-binding protein [Deltaproteobacteria bacterium]
MLQVLATASAILLILGNCLIPKDSSAQVRITIGYAAVSPRAIPLWIAQEEGLFRRYGIEARFVVFRGAPTLVASLVAGHIDLGITSGGTVLGAAAGGIDLKIIAAPSNRLTPDLIARPHIKKVSDLPGKRFGVQSIGGGVWMFTMLGLESLGLDPKRENIRLITIGDSVLIGEALENGTIDGAFLDGALSRRLRRKGFSVLAELYHSNIPFINQGAVVSSTYLQQHSDLVEKVVTGLVEALSFSLAPVNKSSVLKIFSKHLKISDPVVAEEGYQDFLHSVERKPYPSVEALRNAQRMMRILNPQVGGINVEDLIESRFVRKLDESGFIDRVYRGYGGK